jgi:hypothetical protein
MQQLEENLSLICVFQQEHAAGETPPTMPSSASELPTESIEPLIFKIRGQRAILDTDLARLYDVPTFRLNESVKRNSERFPTDFRFQLTREDTAILISQSAISSGAHGGRRKLPWAFTEHGALMAANVLNSPRAVQMSVFIVRAFLRMREELASGTGILKRLAAIDRKLLVHDVVLRDIYRKLEPLLSPLPDRPKREIGFHVKS